MNITSGGALSFRLIILCALWFITYELVAMNAIFPIRLLFHFYLWRPFFHFVIIIAIALILNIKLARDVVFFRLVYMVYAHAQSACKWMKMEMKAGHWIKKVLCSELTVAKFFLSAVYFN